MSPDDRTLGPTDSRKADAYAPFFSKLAVPRFDSPREEQVHRKQRLVIALRAFAQRGFCEGVAGHMTARDPIDPETFWVNPFGRHFGHMRLGSGSRRWRRRRHTRVLVTEQSEASEIADRLGGAKAAIMRNHGLLTVGGTVDEAACWLIQRCCRTQFLAESAGRPLLVDAANACAARSVNGSSIAGWFQFQPIAEEILRTSPDLTD